MLAEAVDDQLGDHRLGECGYSAEEAEEPSAEKRPTVGAEVGEQQPPGGTPAGASARQGVSEWVAVDGVGRRGHGVQGTVNSVRK